MPNRYYYLVASLPYLKFGEPLPIKKEEFLFECAKWLDPAGYDRIAALDIEDLLARPSDPGAAREWKAFEFSMREALAAARRARAEGLREGPDPLIQDIFKEETPLLMEERIQKSRWDSAEGEGLDHHFDIDALAVYFIKLKLLERSARFEAETGKKALEGQEVGYE